MKKARIALLGLALVLTTVASAFALTTDDLGPAATRWYSTTPMGDYWASKSLTIDDGLYDVTMTVKVRGNWNVGDWASFKALLAGSAPNVYTMGAFMRPLESELIHWSSGAESPLITLHSASPVHLTAGPGGIYQLFAATSGNPFGTGQWTFVSGSVSKTPLPAAALLLGSGVLGLFGVGKARRFRAEA